MQDKGKENRYKGRPEMITLGMKGKEGEDPSNNCTRLRFELCSEAKVDAGEGSSGEEVEGGKDQHRGQQKGISRADRRAE